MDKRLKRQADFNEVFHKGKRAFSKSLSIIYVSKPSKSLKIGISVSKKHGNSVTRNKIKRLLRAVYLPLLPYLGNYYIVVLPKVAENYSYTEFYAALIFLLRKEKLINEKAVDSVT